MLGVCFESVQRVALHSLPDPVIEEPTDAIVKVHLAGLCGSDLHPFFGREVGIDPGTVMGHEFVGVVTAVGSSVTAVKEGDRVCAPFTTSCGRCFFCRSGLTSRCQSGQLFGWRENDQGLHGGQAELVRVPLADGTLMTIPGNMSDDTAILLGDNLSTGFFCAQMTDIQPAGFYVVIGCGTVGLLAITAAVRMGATNVLAIDPVESRVQLASKLGAVGFSDSDQALQAVHDNTRGRGADGVMELVGLPAAQELAFRLIRPGGTMSVIGCHCTPHFAFSPSDAYNKNLTYRTGRCPARHLMDRLAPEIAAHPIDLSWCITHRFELEEAAEAYDTFAYRKDNCVKAVIAFRA